MRLVERFAYRHPRFGIPNLMRYIAIGSAGFWVLCMVNPVLYSYLCFSPQLVLQGQIWRLLTFFFIPSNTGVLGLIAIYFYYWIGSTLEQHWGTGQFNIYFFSGALLTMLYGVLAYLFFHQDFFLEDVLVHRPVFVPYRWIVSYIIEGIILLLFIGGIWLGRKSRFLWLCLSCFAFDMFIHIGLGFGLNGIYIMTPHWAFVLPIATAYLFKAIQARWLRIILGVITLYLYIYNGYLLADFLLSPIKAVI